MAVSNNITVFWDVRLYSSVDGYQGNGGSRYLQNVSTYLHKVLYHIPKSQSSLSECVDVFKHQQRRHCNIYHLQVKQDLRSTQHVKYCSFCEHSIN